MIYSDALEWLERETATAEGHAIEAAISPLIKKEPATDKAALQIPLPASLTSERIAQTVTAALSRLMAG